MAKKTVSREDRIKSMCETINKGEHGGENHDAVTYLGSRDTISVVRFSSGCPEIDDALGGGWPKGRIIEIYGPESGGKTTLTLHAIAEHQKAFPQEDIGLIDSEFAFDEEYAQAIGVDTKYLVVHQPEHGIQALNVLEQMMQLGITLVVTDSVAALTTLEDLAGDIGDVSMGAQARLMSPALRRLNMEAGRRGATMMFTNQVREKIGVKFGSPITTPAGRALKHFASIRVHVSRTGTAEKSSDGVALSSQNKADVQKNKVAPPFRVGRFCISFGHGIDLEAAVLDAGISFKVVEKRGSWISFDGENLAQGRAATLDRLRNEPELMERIKARTEEAKDGGVKPDAPKDKGGYKKPKGRSDVRTPVLPDGDKDSLAAPDDTQVADV